MSESTRILAAALIALMTTLPAQGVQASACYRGSTDIICSDLVTGSDAQDAEETTSWGQIAVAGAIAIAIGWAALNSLGGDDVSGTDDEYYRYNTGSGSGASAGGLSAPPISDFYGSCHNPMGC